jgi:NAD(P)-dependent dehydrogenase (short-subunit alcohol dehydrogenase family)
MTSGKLADKVVVITGGASGIGRASARLFSREGANVVIGDVNEKAGAAVVEEIQGEGGGRAINILADVAEPEQVEHLISQAKDTFGHVDVLFGSAGILPLGTAWETSLEDWQRCIDVNLSGNFCLAKYGVPALIEAGGGVILFTSSELGMVGISGAAAYCASKGGVINMTRAVAVDCAPYNIRVNSVAPGPIDTPMTRYWLDRAADPLAVEKEQTEPVLLKRLGTAEEIASVALFLVSDDSSFMTGSLVVADGGATAWYGL